MKYEFKMFSLLWHGNQLKGTMSEKALLPSLLGFVCLLSLRANPVPILWVVGTASDGLCPIPSYLWEGGGWRY